MARRHQAVPDRPVKVPGPGGRWSAWRAECFTHGAPGWDPPWRVPPRRLSDGSGDAFDGACPAAAVQVGLWVESVAGGAGSCFAVAGVEVEVVVGGPGRPQVGVAVTVSVAGGGDSGGAGGGEADAD